MTTKKYLTQAELLQLAKYLLLHSGEMFLQGKNPTKHTNKSRAILKIHKSKGVKHITVAQHEKIKKDYEIEYLYNKK